MASSDYNSGGGRKSNSHIIEELEALGESLYQSHTSSTTNRRTASLVLPRSSVPPISAADADISTVKNEEKLNPKPRTRRMSLSPWRSRPTTPNVNNKQTTIKASVTSQKKFEDKPETSEKKGLWNWKPIRALTHIAMQKLSCLFSVEVVAIQGLPTSMNGLRLSVCARKKESKDGAVQTMPSRVTQGAADFEETLFIRTHVYYTPGNANHTKFEPRPFIVYVFAVDAQELDFGKNSVDLSELVQESIQKSLEGTRIRQWETSFSLSGKAKGGELVLKLGIQIMEKDGGVGIYSQGEGQKSGKNVARKQSKASFSVPSPRLTSKAEPWTPSKPEARPDLQGIDELNLDEPAPQIPTKPEEPETKVEDIDFPDFEVVDKGVEIQDKEVSEKEVEEEDSDMKSATSNEVVKEIVVHDQVHVTRLTELDSIAQQIKALESMMEDEKSTKADEENDSQRLDEDEETVTREFLQMLEGSDTTELNSYELPLIKPENNETFQESESESKVYLPDLGKGLGCVVQTRNGGYLAAMNPLNTIVAKKDTPKLAMQISKPFVLPSSKSTNGFELFQMMAALGPEELGAEFLSLMPMDELMGKTAEQIAFEGVASALIQGRNKEGNASSSAARIIAAVKSMANAMSSGRKERISTGIWNVSEDPLTVDEILSFSLQKIESMAVEALKIQAGISEEEAPFDVSPLKGTHPLASATSLEECMKNQSKFEFNAQVEDLATIAISVVIQLRDPIRQYEAVGGPMIALIHATRADLKSFKYDDEITFKVASLHVGGLKVPTIGRKNTWDTEKQRLTSMQWLVAYGLGKAGKKGKFPALKGQDVLWSISSRIMAEMWLKAIRNPDIKFAK